jgi:glycosyltransferase involved in cell wall biosynthesis
MKIKQPSKKIVFYDLSLMGIGRNQEKRTGLYRVTFEILKRLLVNKNIIIYYYASLNNHSDCQFFLRKHSSFQRPIIGCNYDHPWVAAFMKALNKKYPIVLFSSYYSFPKELRKYADKCILVIHDLIPILFPHLCAEGDGRNLMKILETIENTDIILCVSKNTRNDLIHYKPNIKKNNINIMYLGASEIFQPIKNLPIIRKIKQKYGIPANATYILSCSMFEPRKNVKAIINAYLKLKKYCSYNNTYLVLVGSEISYFHSDISKLMRKDAHIIYTGYISDEDLSALYSGAELFIFLSLYEGFGLPVLEAMYCGCPVIASNNSSLREIVDNAGIKVNPENQMEIIESIDLLMRNNYLRNRFVIKSLKRAASFSYIKTMKLITQKIL